MKVVLSVDGLVGSKHRLAWQPRMEALGHAIDEEIGDHPFAQPP